MIGRPLSDKDGEDSLEQPDVSKEKKASEEKRVLTINISNYIDFVKEKRENLVQLSIIRAWRREFEISMKSGVWHCRLKAVDLEIWHRDLEDVRELEKMMIRNV